jgi:hypothetical protein
MVSSCIMCRLPKPAHRPEEVYAVGKMLFVVILAACGQSL